MSLTTSIAAVVLAGICIGGPQTSAEPERAAIERTVLDYAEGYYDHNTLTYARPAAAPSR